MRVLVTLTRTETYTLDEVDSTEDAVEGARFAWDQDNDDPEVVDVTIDPTMGMEP